MENRNFIIFITISIAILFVWEALFVAPAREADRERLEAEQQHAEKLGLTLPQSAVPSVPGAVSGSAPGTNTSAPPSLDDDTGGTELSRDEALTSARIPFESEEIIGTISLKGGRIDDVTLKNYREEIDDDSPNVVLFSPEKTEGAYFADFSWRIAQTAGQSWPTGETLWQLEEGQIAGIKLTPQTPIKLVWDNGQGLTFRRTISIDENYMFNIAQRVENNTSGSIELYPYGQLSRIGKPETTNFFILHEGFLGIFDGELSEKKYDKVIEDGNFKKTSTGGWLGITDKYWLAALAPDQTKTFDGSYTTTKSSGTDRFNASYIHYGVTVEPGGSAENTTNLFVGAKKNRVLNSYRDNLGIDRFEFAIDWGWFRFITKPIFSMLDYFGHLIGNFGVAILLVTVVIKGLLFPLANKSYESMSKMKKLQPEMTALRDRYTDDKAKQQQEVMALYKREGVNPLAGCLPMLIQIPIFFALYKVIFVTIEIRQAPFFGWIQDLAAQDPTSILNLFGLLPYDPSGWPLIGSVLGIGVWPLFMGITMFFQMKMNPAPQDPIQEKMFTFMPIIFTFMLARFPAGLVIYWAWNNLLSMSQQYVIMRKNDVEIELLKNLKLDRFFKTKEPATAAIADETKKED